MKCHQRMSRFHDVNMATKQLLKNHLQAVFSEQKQIITQAKSSGSVRDAYLVLRWLCVPVTRTESVPVQVQRAIHSSYAVNDQLLSLCNLQNTTGCENESTILLESCLEFSLDQVSVEWSVHGLAGTNRQLFNDFFLGENNCGVVFSTLCRFVTNTSPGIKLDNCVNLLENFLNKQLLNNVLLEQCKSDIEPTDKSSPEASLEQERRGELITFITTLPDRVANKLQLQTSSIFLPDEYFQPVVSALLCAMCTIYRSLEKEESASSSFLCALLGKLCVAGHADRVLKPLIPHMCYPALFTGNDTTEHGSYIWWRVCERVVTQVPDRCMESVLQTFLLLLPHYTFMSKLLGSSVCTNANLKFLLTNKFLFLRTYTSDLILKNILGYLATTSSSKHLYFEVLYRLLEVWGDASALSLTAYEQHIYITRAIHAALTFLPRPTPEHVQSELLSKLLSGVSRHLESSSERVRRVGMVTAEAVTATLDLNQHKLQFQYDEDEETRHLKSLLVRDPPPLPPDTTRQEDKGFEPTRALKALSLEASSAVTRNTANTAENMAKSSNNITSDLDSDDDLEPYDVSNDVKTTKEKAPRYLRDCMLGLINSSENPDRVEACLREAEPFIRRHAQSAVEIAAEFAKILLHLQDNFNFPEYNFWRHGALVALLVVAPLQVSEYLISQFYERNYNIMQRLDILQSLADAAKELSDPSKADVANKDMRSGALISDVTGSVTSRLKAAGRGEEDEANESEDWRAVVQRRIDRNTKWFHPHQAKAPAPEVTNRFAPYAGAFFYPLLTHFDRVQPHLDLLGADHLVLTRLVHTLGVIVLSAQHAPICSRLAASLLEFLWAVRYHTQQPVRSAVLGATCLAIVAVPPHALVGELSAQVVELREWLTDVVTRDASTDCRKLASQALLLLEGALKEVLSSDKG